MNRDEYYKNLSLAHDGILGMKWGQRNGPPYPLSAGAHSSAERAAGSKGWTRQAREEIQKEKRNKATDITLDGIKVRTNADKARAMTDEQLQSANRRAALENQYLKNNPDRDRAWEVAENTRQVANSASNLARKVEKATTKKVKTGMDVSKLSDKELQQIVNRLNLEQRYDQLTTKEETNRGATITREIIDILGDVAGLATAGVLLYSKLKHSEE